MTTEEPAAPTGPARLQKVLSAAGVASRRVVEDLIAEGRITVNGEVAELGAKADPLHDEIAVDGVVTGVDMSRVTFVLNKPVGTISTASDTHGRQTVVDLVDTERRIYPVGRLDADSEGLLLLTNDGGLAQRLTHPSYGVDKEYLVSVDGEPNRGSLRTLREGVELDDGRTSPARVSQLSPGLLRIVIHEGRNRQIRRMCDAIGHPVTRLVRTRIGPLSDNTLQPGEWREVTGPELRALETAAQESAQRAAETDQ